MGVGRDQAGIDQDLRRGRLGKAVIARIGHVQPVGADHLRRAEQAAGGPGPHQGVTADHRHVELGREAVQRVAVALGTVGRRQAAAPLLVHEDDVGAGGAHRRDALTGQFGETLHRDAGHRVVTAGLPDHEVGPLGQNVPVEAAGHGLGVITTLAAVEDRDDGMLGASDVETSLQVFLQLGGVGGGGGGGPRPFRGRGAEGDDADVGSRLHQGGHVGKLGQRPGGNGRLRYHGLRPCRSAEAQSHEGQAEERGGAGFEKGQHRIRFENDRGGRSRRPVPLRHGLDTRFEIGL